MRLPFLLIFLFIAMTVPAQSLPDFGGLVKAVLGTGGPAETEEDAFDPEIDFEMLGATLDYIDDAARVNSASSAAEMVSPERRASWLGSLRLPGVAAEALSREFYRPVKGVVTSPYGYRARFRRMHKGIDLNLSVGDTVRSASGGRVRSVGYDRRGYGHYVVVLHPTGAETVYGHLSASLVAEGDAVDAGSPLGLGGSTGRSTGPHLHFEVRWNGLSLDPSELFDFGAPLRIPARAVTPRDVIAALITAESMMDSSMPKEALEVERACELPEYGEVLFGDTPWSVAWRWQVPLTRIWKLNGLKPFERPLPGTKLRLR